MGILEVLGIVFIVLKLVGIIAWSWWIVLAPLFVSLVIFTSVALVCFIKGNRGQ